LAATATDCRRPTSFWIEPAVSRTLRRMNATVIAVSRDGSHNFSKDNAAQIRLIAGLGVVGDAHAGATVKHRSRVKRDPTVANLRQVHELHDELNGKGFAVSPGVLGENVTTRGLDLLGLPTGTRLRLGAEAVVEITGLRNPCYQLDNFQQGLMAACLDRDADGNLIRKAGVMAVVIDGGEVRPGDSITVELPAAPHRRLEAV
jgi:MOSC domain-containing protein YiiM